MRMTVAEARKLNVLPAVQKRGKYNNRRTFYNGNWYDSALEAKRAFELDMLHKGKQIRGWQRQVKLPIDFNGVHICDYICDFVVHNLDGSIDYEDVKGVETDVFKLKSKLVWAFYKIKIKLVYGKSQTKINLKVQRQRVSRSLRAPTSRNRKS